MCSAMPRTTTCIRIRIDTKCRFFSDLECQVGKTVIAFTETGTTMTGKEGGRLIRGLGYDLGTELLLIPVSNKVSKSWPGDDLCNATPCQWKNLCSRTDHCSNGIIKSWRPLVTRSLTASESGCAVTSCEHVHVATVLVCSFCKRGGRDGF